MLTSTLTTRIQRLGATALVLSLALAASAQLIAPELPAPSAPAPPPAAAALPASELRPLPGPGLTRTPATLPGTPPQATTTRPGAWGDTLAMALPLAAVVGLVLICAAVLRRVARNSGGLCAAMTAGRSPGGIVEVLCRYPVSRGQALVLLRVDRRVLLLSHAAGARHGAASFTTLSEFSDHDDVASILAKVNDAEPGKPGAWAAAKSANARFHAALRLFEGPAPAEPSPESERATGRRIVGTDHGDRVSVWDEHAASLPPAIAPPRETHDPASGVHARLAALRGRATLGTMHGAMGGAA